MSNSNFSKAISCDCCIDIIDVDDFVDCSNCDICLCLECSKNEKYDIHSIQEEHKSCSYCKECRFKLHPKNYEPFVIVKDKHIISYLLKVINKKLQNKNKPLMTYENVKVIVEKYMIFKIISENGLTDD